MSLSLSHTHSAIVKLNMFIRMDAQKVIAAKIFQTFSKSKFNPSTSTSTHIEFIHFEYLLKFVFPIRRNSAYSNEQGTGSSINLVYFIMASGHCVHCTGSFRSILKIFTRIHCEIEFLLQFMKPFI